MRSYETRKAVLLKTYLASDIKVPVLRSCELTLTSMIWLAFSCLLVLYGHVALPYVYASVHANVIYTIQSRIT